MNISRRKEKVASQIVCAIGLVLSGNAVATMTSIGFEPETEQVVRIADHNPARSCRSEIVSCDGARSAEFPGAFATPGGQNTAREGYLVRGDQIRESASSAPDLWEVFPAQIGGHKAYISFNRSYAKIANEDDRTSLFRIRLGFKHPTVDGFPSGDEFREINQIEDRLTAAAAARGGVEIGRVTVDRHREFLFYVGFDRGVANEVVASVGATTTYQLLLSVQSDAEKKAYWRYLYPTEDDWQVIGDMHVLDTLHKQGDIDTRTRRVSHWAYFSSPQEAQQFADWAKANLYRDVSVAPTEDRTKFVVRFGHEGTTELSDIIHHTIAINRAVNALGGNYDGWETVVVRD